MGEGRKEGGREGGTEGTEGRKNRLGGGVEGLRPPAPVLASGSAPLGRLPITLSPAGHRAAVPSLW